MKNYLDYDWAVTELELPPKLGRTEVKNIYCFTLAGYRERISYNWFFHGLKNRNDNKDKNLFYRVYFNLAFERIKGLKCKETVEILPKLEAGDFIVCDNLYDFYEKIGWDRKAQKYNK